jgi:hypothetical protein
MVEKTLDDIYAVLELIRLALLQCKEALGQGIVQPQPE